MRPFLVVLALAGTITAAAAKELLVSCEVVRQFAPAAQALSAKQQRDLARKYNVSRKMIRQARECLK